MKQLKIRALSGRTEEAYAGYACQELGTAQPWSNERRRLEHELLNLLKSTFREDLSFM
jgi:hypothetical protein